MSTSETILTKKKLKISNYDVTHPDWLSKMEQIVKFYPN